MNRALVLVVWVAAAVAWVVAVGQSPQWQPTIAPHWIWTSAGDAGELERTIQVDQRVQSAMLRFAADFCDARVEINGQPVLRVEPYSPTVDVDVTSAFRLGENRIKVVAKGVDGPAAFACSLWLTTVDGRQIEIISDGQWQH